MQRLGNIKVTTKAQKHLSPHPPTPTHPFTRAHTPVEMEEQEVQTRDVWRRSTENQENKSVLGEDLKDLK